MKIIVTGGYGFIGSAIIRQLVRKEINVLNIDKLTYAANPNALQNVKGSVYYSEVIADICHLDTVCAALSEFKPDAIVHLAAETHVDNSIKSSDIFIQTNIFGTQVLLESIRSYQQLHHEKPIRLIHVSTDEVFGELLDKNEFFTESSHYDPSSPYSASKAASDHLVKSYARTYGLSTITLNISNNFGPFQHNEKLIPKIIKKKLSGEKIPIYGDGQQLRDWIFVEDTASAIIKLLENDPKMNHYVIGANSPVTNLEIVRLISHAFHEFYSGETAFGDQDIYSTIDFIDDRLGHDFCYRVNPKRYQSEFGNLVSEMLYQQIKETVKHFILAAKKN